MINLPACLRRRLNAMVVLGLLACLGVATAAINPTPAVTPVPSWQDTTTFYL